ncbi:uncharacterized protein LOC110990540 isoform X2 [Acanthaster planci]|nr:uncharacterized protein LOC110990540 isoform X2 [Acanthaster planci]
MIAWKLRSRAPVRLAESLGCDKEEIAKFRAFGRILETKEKVDLFFSLLLSWRDRQPGNHVDRLCTVLKKIGSGHLMKELREHEASVQASNQPGHMSADEKLKNEAGASQEQTTLDATTTEVELSQRTLSKIAQRLHYASLQGLAENLGLSGENIDFCKSDVLKTDSAKIVFMLFYWKEVHRLNQVESLGEALEKIGRRDLAIELHGISQKDQHFPITLEKTLENQTDTSDEHAGNDAAAETLGSEETSDQSGQLTTSRSVGSIEEELTDNTLYTISQNFDPRKLTGLAAKLGLENVTVLQLQADFPNNVVEQTYRLLIDWKQRQPAGVNKSQALYDALASETIGMRNLAALLQGTDGLISDRRVSNAGEACAAALEDYYKDSCSHVSLLPWVHDDMKHITDIHTRPRLTLGAKGATRLKETSLAAESFSGTILESYEEIFLEKTKEDNHVLVAVINGLHGTGKTTLFHKMAYDWACGKALKRFKLLILLKMSALEQSSDLIEAMFGQLLDEETSIQKDALKEYVRNPGNVSKVLVLLDGFDEFMTTNLERSSFGSVLKILKQKVFRGCTVLVSTRPSHFNKLLTHELVREPFTHVRILGFSDDDVVEYVNKFFRPEEKGFLGLDGRKSNKPIQVAGGAAQAEGILNKIRSSGVLFHLARTPMLLLFMCLLWREEKTLPETLSGLFGDAMYFIFNAKGVPEEEMSDIVIGIGEAGLKHGFLSQNQDTFVKKSDFKQPNMLDKALEVGILTKQKVLQRLRTQNIIQFIHPTFQEFSAAKYLQSLLKVDIKTFRTTLYEVISRDAVGFEYLLRFCCGDNQDCTVEVLKQFVEIFLDDLSLYSTLGQLALHCYFEGRSKFLPPKEFTDAFITTDIIFDGRDWDDSDLFISLAYFLKRVAEHDKEHGTRHLAKIQKLVLINCKLTNFDEDLAFAMTAMTNLRSVELESCSLTGKAVALVTRSLKSAANLAELDFASNGHLGGTATTWNIYFKQLSHIQKLDFEWLLIKRGWCCTCS